MSSLQDYPIAVVDDDYAAESAAGRVVRALVGAFEARGHAVLAGLTVDDARAGRVLYTGLSAVLVSIDGFADRDALIEALDRIVALALARAPDLPLFLYGERRMPDDPPVALMERIDGYLYLHEDSPAFMAGYVSSAIHRYLDAMLPPFFKALVRYTDAAKYSWHTPGHGGGVAFMRSPVGQAFHRFFGETTLRADLSVSVPELGSLLDHAGPVREAEREAAQSFGADSTFFVTNGTSSANKIVWSGLVGPGDKVLVDRNCHKSIVHALIMTGASPIYLRPSRNAYGIIGPIPRAQFEAAAIAAQAGGRIRIATVTNSTYDGLCINADAVKLALAPVADAVHFDEAWLAQAHFHEFYRGFYAMSDGAGPVEPLVFSTQSTHKVLAAISQASMVHLKEGSAQKLDPDRFNEAFMMHSSTSPWYGIIASCDVAARMMRGAAGRTLVDETLHEAAAFRRSIAALGDTFAARGDWWFKLWEPAGAGFDQVDWTLKPGDAWHGFAEITEGFSLLDPMKVTILCPGLGDEDGIPAPIVAKFLWSRGIVVEKIGTYHFLILFTLGVSRGKWSNLVTELLAFRAHYAANTPLADVMPDLVRESRAYERMGLRDLCTAQHAVYQDGRVLAIQNAMFETLPEQVLTPQQAHAELAGGRVEQVGLDALHGRVLARMVVPYPPGIALIVPGERVSSPLIIEYLRFAAAWDRQFPGFEADIHGVRKDNDGNYLLDCVRR
ncbi:MAG: lysine decarboxylase [Acidiphilium sp. 37-64-53]|uniref:arginine/lysine/ornithine decarboxylase n=1 Tax=Acidiphilium TaxID=522 RepID=UPI000BD77E95|nr:MULTISPECIES: arginine/lysine/ornithine decarboxylase [Acidiphilium]OYW02721.1 MAG: lysine decarboxylase [Acidiphilium sp. 37-64-53]OZB29321.1 MAG: lysine decarboxylase [Acidiphilium sp. 34-64-41]HQT85360.1 arginine/lysine/ornithine decarboxylase [Acidiphilium rubrum]